MAAMKLALVVDGRRSLGRQPRRGDVARRSRTRAEGTKLAQASLLRIGDFGSGWTSEAATGRLARA